MDEKLIYSLWDRFDKSDAVELLYESGDSKLRLRKAEPTGKQVYNGCITSTGMPAATFGVTMPQGMQPGTFIQAGDATSVGNAAGVISTDSLSGIAGSANSGNASTKAQTADSGVFVKSPLPGTFYRSASPEDEPYVMLGSKVKQGDVVGIVESMKMMNEIVAPADGTVAEILAENGSIVGYDDKLIRLS